MIDHHSKAYARYSFCQMTEYIYIALSDLVYFWFR